MEQENGISRRSFLQGVGGVAAAVAVLGSIEAKADPIPASIVIPKETLLEMYRRMQRIRIGETKVKDLVYANQTPCLRSTGHPSLGEEATCVGVAMAMDQAKGDLLCGTHRSHGYPLGLGLPLNPWMAELMCKETGCNLGHGGSMHIAEVSIGILGMTGIVGAGVPIALGAAKFFQAKGMKAVGVSTCGDAAMQSSGFNSSLGLAKTWNAPCVFVVANNQIGMGIYARWVDPNMIDGKDAAVRASGFGIPGFTVDGNDIFAVYKAAKYCIERARADKGPSLLECVTWRHTAHSSGIRPHEILAWPYNDPATHEYWLARDPIPRFENIVLTQKFVTADELANIKKSVTAEVEAAVKFGIDSPYGDPAQEYKYFDDVFKA
jgi:TPP-dependent pyruvate/acetoin dehydrogenase alpha subunit